MPKRREPTTKKTRRRKSLRIEVTASAAEAVVQILSKQWDKTAANRRRSLAAGHVLDAMYFLEAARHVLAGGRAPTIGDFRNAAADLNSKMLARKPKKPIKLLSDLVPLELLEPHRCIVHGTRDRKGRTKWEDS